GCSAQLHPDELRQLKGVDLILFFLEKEDFEIFFKRFYYKGKNPQPFVFVNHHLQEHIYSWDRRLIHNFEDRTRAFIKIQDGCENFCSYCVIPYLRGKYRSRPPDNVLDQINLLEAKDIKEIVLTGIHIGKYGMENQNPQLVSLLKTILSFSRIPRVRLSSIEPQEISDELIELIATEPRICRHLHIPLQSGSDRILNLMNRHYSVHFYQTLIRKLRDRMPEIGIGMDVIVGHPSESEQDFMDTYHFIKHLPPVMLHVFSYSDRPLTQAGQMEPKVPPDEIQARANQLITLSRYKKQEFCRGFIGQKMEVLIESSPQDGKWYNGLTGNYIRVNFDHDRPQPNCLVQAGIDYIDQSGNVFGSISSEI
ncbi:MAG: MiaB/RimO family radical SAM methylthiotransferase, partial [Candidatus Delongbacteria bacterium]|nr:MiaB/RimO family radical SAM methylthiotransferase [Candidatus Delongbacteria bacterium]